MRASAAAREITAQMEIEDGASLEMSIRLPASMPLRPPEVECKKKVGGALEVGNVVEGSRRNPICRHSQSAVRGPGPGHPSKL